MKTKKIATGALVGFVLLAGYTFAMGMMGYGGGGMMGGYAQGYQGDAYSQQQERGLQDRFFGRSSGGYGYGGYESGYGRGGMMGPGMMGGYYGYGGASYGMGMMGGCPMAQGYGGYPVNATITHEQAEQAIESYIGENFEIRETMEFQYNYYAIVEEKDTGKAAFELLVNRHTGTVTPEPGPNMMWNLKYGHHSQGYSGENRITEEQAVELAQRYLERAGAGWKADEHADEFYGYYTLHTLDESGDITGMLSVNGFTGQVWFHTWHGEYLGEERQEEGH